jgi:three-Cys-motif partner protein
LTSNDSFFQRRQAAAVLKHGILKRYPTVFATMTGRRSTGGRVLYLDGHAGPGRYEDGSPGSPLLAVQTAARVSEWRRDVECVFIEHDECHFANLKACLTQEAPPDLTWHAWHGDVTDLIDDVLHVADGAPLLAFFDPFGVALPYDTLVGKLLARPAVLPTEVLLNLNLEMVWRIGGLLTGAETRSVHTIERLDRFFGDTWWQDVFAAARRGGEPGSAARAAQEVAAEYCGRVQAATGYGTFSVPVRRRPTHHPLFLLVLFFRHPVAPWKFNEAVSMANREWRHECREADLAEQMARRVPGQGSLFDEDEPGLEAWEKIERANEAEIEKQWVADIRANLVGMTTQHGSVRLQGHVADVYGETLGQAREKHVKAAWDEAAAAGLVEPRDKSVKRIEQAVVQRVPG